MDRGHPAHAGKTMGGGTCRGPDVPAMCFHRMSWPNAGSLAFGSTRCQIACMCPKRLWDKQIEDAEDAWKRRMILWLMVVHRTGKTVLPPFFVAPSLPERVFRSWVDDYWAKEVSGTAWLSSTFTAAARPPLPALPRVPPPPPTRPPRPRIDRRLRAPVAGCTDSGRRASTSYASRQAGMLSARPATAVGLAYTCLASVAFPAGLPTPCKHSIIL